MPPPFSVRSGAQLEKDLGQWDANGNITIPGNLTVGGTVSASNVGATEVQSVSAGDSTITVGGTAANPTVAVNQANLTAKVASVTAGNSTITVGGTAANPTVALGTVPESAVTNLVSDLAAKAPLASPALTGTATAVNLTVSGTLSGQLNATSTAFSAQTDSGTTSSTTYTATRTGSANVAGVSFTAPPSGAVRIDWSCGVSNTAGNFALVSIQVLTGSTIGSGSSVLAASDNFALQTNATTETKLADFYYVTGLTAGSSYNAQLMYRVNTGTGGTFDRPKILVQGA